MTSNDYNYSDTRRWDPNRGALPVYGTAGTDRKAGRKRRGGPRRRLRRRHRASMTRGYLPFKAWLRQQKAKEG